MEGIFALEILSINNLVRAYFVLLTLAIVYFLAYTKGKKLISDLKKSPVFLGILFLFLLSVWIYSFSVMFLDFGK